MFNACSGVVLSCYTESILWLCGFGYFVFNNYNNMQKISIIKTYVCSLDNCDNTTNNDEPTSDRYD